jgi:dTDP-4-amino-4,6-dideoxygalactose transaminase
LKTKIYLSPPNIDRTEISNVVSAMESGWISPFGSFTNDFTAVLSEYFKKKTLLTNSGTSAIHLALRVLGIKEGDYVLCSNFTFAASVFPVLYQKAIPILVGSEQDTWNLSPDYLEEAVSSLRKKGIAPKALVLAHIYGMPACLERIIKICEENEILLIEDSAETLGSHHDNIPLGSWGRAGVMSFNGNKIVTCSTGGAVILPDEETLNHAKKLSVQAKEPVDYYLHNEVGYNFAQSNILAAIGLAQFGKLKEKTEKRRQIFDRYLSFFEEKTEIWTQKEGEKDFSNRWLSTFCFAEKSLNVKIKEALEKENIESRFLWNPMHAQPVFKTVEFFGDKSLDMNLFENGLCLPSGDNLRNEDLERIYEVLEKIF